MKINEKISIFKKNKKMFLSNAFFTSHEILKLTEDSSVIKLEKENAIIFFINKGDFYKCSFFAQSKIELIELLNNGEKQLDKPIVIDAVYKSQNYPTYIELLIEAGFKFHARYRRMICKGHFNFRDNQLKNEIVFAEVNEAEAIFELLMNTFDIYGDHLPSLAEIKKALKQNEITVVKIEDEIVGLSYFEEKGKSMVYLRAIAVTEKGRRQGISKDLIIHKMQQYQIPVNFILWVIEDNYPAVRNYGNFGFENDGLINEVYVLQK